MLWTDDPFSILIGICIFVPTGLAFLAMAFKKDPQEKALGERRELILKTLQRAGYTVKLDYDGNVTSIEKPSGKSSVAPKRPRRTVKAYEPEEEGFFD